MNIFKLIIDYFKNEVNPDSCPWIDTKDLGLLLLGELGYLIIEDDFKDTRYRLVPKNKLMRFIGSLPPEKSYEKDSRDCDDYAAKLDVAIKEWLPGACSGRGDIKYREGGRVKKHEVVIVGTTDREFIYINGQDKSIYYVPDDGEWCRIEF